jgi:hypothetical protein
MVCYCTICFCPDTKPDLQLNEDGACSACVVSANIFRFTELTPKGAKRFLGERSLSVRLS